MLKSVRAYVCSVLTGVTLRFQVSVYLLLMRQQAKMPPLPLYRTAFGLFPFTLPTPPPRQQLHFIKKKKNVAVM